MTACGEARALWVMGPEQVALRATPVVQGDDDCVIETLFSGISRGTERLVFENRVPPTEYQLMRAPFQDGAFPYPVKYGYSAVGRIACGSDKGKLVFALYPHQDRFACPIDAAVPVPDDVPADRAVLAANMETALNIIWDARVQPGDRVAVVGTGVVGGLVGYLAARIPATDVSLVDVDPAKSRLAKILGCDFSSPDTARGEADVVIHASASDAGLATALSLAGREAAVVEVSWFGTGETRVPLGGAFHQRRLRLVGSQVGGIPADHAARWTYRRRLEVALRLLADPCLDAMISGETRFDDLARDYASILRAQDTLCHRIRYES